MEPEIANGGKIGWTLHSLGDHGRPEIKGEREEGADCYAPGVIVSDPVYQ
jgi:hypothetical protein